MENFDLTKIAIFCIKKNAISYINKKKGMNYHINYYLELARKDEDIKRIISRYDERELLDFPSKTHEYINCLLVKEENMCIILNMAPQTLMPTTTFTVLLPEETNSFQKKILNEWKGVDWVFLDLGVFDSKMNSFQSLMKEEDYFKPNAYLLNMYLNDYSENFKK